MTFHGREQLHFLSIKLLENVPRPIFAATSLLSNSAKLLNLWYDICTLRKERLKDFLSQQPFGLTDIDNYQINIIVRIICVDYNTDNGKSVLNEDGL